ncbi:YciI family protein [Streptomyces sp. NPDC051677]|uniref:YciI family protein n=1 Tax=Streptomyces sp. NPDC051677 TaxID=3365669 RepID=UPI0037D6986F
MLFAVWCTAGERAEEIRAKWRRQHFRYIVSQRSVIRTGGALFAEDGHTIRGMLQVLDLPDREAAYQWVLDDPFGREGMWATISVEAFHPRIPEPEPGFLEAQVMR